MDDDVREVAPLRPRLARLRELAACDERLTAAVDAAESMRQELTNCTAEAERAAATLEAVRQMVLDEEAAVTGSRARAAADVLEAVKAGGDQAPITSTSSDRLDSLHLARQAAERELATASEARTKAQADYAQAIRVLAAANACVEEVNALAAQEVATLAADRALKKAQQALRNPTIEAAQLLLAAV